MKKIFILSFLILGFCANTWAGDKKRNGGTLLSCGTGLKVLDLFEIQNSYGYDLDIPSGQDFKDILNGILSRLERHNPQRAQLYRSYLKSFEQEARFSANADFMAITDLGEGIPIPKDCSLVQAVSQFHNPMALGVWYLFNRDLWMQLSPAQQAALTLHEFIYREAFQDDNSLENSMGVRFFTGYLFSSKAPKDNLQTYLRTLKLSDLTTAEYHGFVLPIRNQKTELPIIFKDENTLKTVSFGNRLSLKNSEVLQDIRCLGEAANYPVNGIQMHFEGGEVAILGKCPMYMNLSNGSDQVGYTVARVFHLSKEGKIKKAVAFRDTLPSSAYTIHFQNREFELFSAASNLAELTFDSQEQLQEIRFQIVDTQGFNGTYLKKGKRNEVLYFQKDYRIPVTRSEQGIPKQIR